MPLRIAVDMTVAFMRYEAARAPPDLGLPTAKLTLASDHNAPGAARRVVGDLCRGCNSDCIADAQLIVSELVTNAVMHSHGDDVVVLLWRGAKTIDGRVCDGGSGFTPRPGSPSHAGVGGRGLGVVDALVESWGSRRAPSSVWFRSAMGGAA